MIEPVSTVSFRPFNIEIPRQSSATAPAVAMDPIPVRNGHARPDTQLQEMIQAGRQTSALLSLMPGPNLGFFQAPSPLQLGAGKGALLAPSFGPGAFSPTGGREQLDVPLLETMETGRETSTLLSGLTGPGARAFPAPVPPAFEPRQRTFAPPAATGTGMANEAYRMESQAQRNLQMERVSGPARRWEWLA